MKLRILSVGHKMPTWVQTGFGDYHKRILPMLSVELVNIPPAKRCKNPTAGDIHKYKSQEGNAILNARQHGEKLWLLDVKGKMLTTESLSDKLQIAMQDGNNVALVIGGADGVSADVLAVADFKWSLSALTLPHPLVRVLLIEQLYRAMSIIHNHPYHRGE